MYYINLLKTKDFLFKLSNFLKLSLYVYFINHYLYNILTRNNTVYLLKVLRNLRLRRLLKINYNNYYYVIKDFNAVSKIIFRNNRKPSWFKFTLINVIILFITFIAATVLILNIIIIIIIVTY